jgi:hypothetical protein
MNNGWQALTKKREKIVGEIKSLHRQLRKIDYAIRESTIKDYIKGKRNAR